jgi:hypothetical protein
MTTTDPEEARRRADEAAEQARAQLADARSRMAGTAARARKSRWLLDSNHLGELFAQALGLQK